MSDTGTLVGYFIHILRPKCRSDLNYRTQLSLFHNAVTSHIGSLSSRVSLVEYENYWDYVTIVCEVYTEVFINELTRHMVHMTKRHIPKYFVFPFVSHQETFRTRNLVDRTLCSTRLLLKHQRNRSFGYRDIKSLDGLLHYIDGCLEMLSMNLQSFTKRHRQNRLVDVTPPEFAHGHKRRRAMNSTIPQYNNVVYKSSAHVSTPVQNPVRIDELGNSVIVAHEPWEITVGTQERIPAATTAPVVELISDTSVHPAQAQQYSQMYAYPGLQTEFFDVVPGLAGNSIGYEAYLGYQGSVWGYPYLGYS